MEDLYNSYRFADAYLLARYAYRIGEPMMNDSEYRLLEDAMACTDQAYLTKRSYDDDPVPEDLLKEFNLQHLIVKQDDIPEELLNGSVGDRTMSIKPLDNYKDAYDFFMSTPNEDKVMSSKCNGANLNATYIKDNDKDFYCYKGGLTRGRNGDCMNVSSNLYKVVPKKIVNDECEDKIRIYGEGLVDDSAYKNIPRKSGKDFTSSRMAAISMLRVEIEPKYYKHLRFYAYRAEGIKCNTAWGTFKKLEELGFTTPPKIYIKASEVPKDFEAFKVWLKSKMDWFYEENKKYDLPADGIVVDINDKNFVGVTDGHYTSRDCALKFEYWSEKYYVGVIKDILIEQQRVLASVVVLIEPLVTEDGVTVRRVTGYNLDILVKNHLTVGSKVYFGRNSEAISCILFGERLKEVLDSPELISEGVKTSSSF